MTDVVLDPAAWRCTACGRLNEPHRDTTCASCLTTGELEAVGVSKESICNLLEKLDPVITVHGCRCGFIGRSVGDVWDHQQREMERCEESDFSGRQDECDHCRGIVTGDAQEIPLYDIHELKQQFSEDREDSRDGGGSGG